ncbi:sensor histidine kinase [Fischerella sp. NIES-3754]|uniref:sensor histidine kinase n=1 Tax=Fischerella sp. NIES-3754 TaxID=1752063 RepID=UPI0007224596|nr:HAMP domain-containing sensor histidine kinase [Fischerella sp. NIES-3754]BAU08391.1 two-component sensor histidine kinase [Fischerella sp. NIES-3754]BCX10762.1 MAG: two-component sensor histidine kinase [Fischerella sp.]
MAWATDLTQISNLRFNRLRNRLLLFYFLAITAILVFFATTIYVLVSRDRQQQFDQQLQQIGTSAAGIWEVVQHEYEELTTQPEYAAYRRTLPHDRQGQLLPIALVQLMGKYQMDTAPPLVPGTLLDATYGIAWYTPTRELLIYEGILFNLPLPDQIPAEGLFVSRDKTRSFLQPVYKASQQSGQELVGYVAVTGTLAELETELAHLRANLLLGVAIVAGLVVLAGWWLTRQSIAPVATSLAQLKQFTADASHELRTPLTAIQASAEVLQSHPERIHPGDIEKVTAIATAATRMGHLLKDLLLIARLDAQAPDQRGWHVIDLDELLEDLVELYRDRAQAAQLMLTYQSQATAKVYGDAEQLQRLFANLLSNALQYTLTGGTITVTLQQAGKAVLVRVQDTGIGIAPADLPHVFDRFWRTEEARHHYRDGSGLGLAIAKTIVERHHGHISVQSQPHQGTCFEVKLPCR